MPQAARQHSVITDTSPALARIDPITLELVKGALRSARQEMEALIERTAMSPFIREKKDYFASFFTRAGKMLYGTNLPLGANLMECIFREYPPETMRPLDLYWYNDCYGSGGGVSHAPDMVFTSPVFVDEQLVGFALVWGHFWDIGGMVPGSISPAATEIFHEGIIVPPIRIYREGILNEEAFRLFVRNSRFPEILQGDIRALMASCRMGEKRLGELVTRFGQETMLAAFEQILDQSEQAARTAIAERVPDGTYRFTDYLDGDGISQRALSVNLTLTKEKGRVSLDFTDTSDQAQGAVNFIMHESVPKYMYGLYLTADDPTIMLNEGFARALDEVKLRSGSLVCPNFPAPVAMRSNTMIRVNACVLGTLAQATQGNASAASPVYVIYMLRSLNPTTGEYTLCIEGVAVGFGARPFADGIDAVYFVAQKNYPAEYAEMELGIRIERYAIHPDSGGPGHYRGGCGVIRDIRILAEEAIFANRMENVIYPPWGVNGGQAGRPGRIVVNPGTPEEREIAPLTEGVRLRQGDLLRLMTCGGGGWGNPFDREVGLVENDVRGGFVSVDAARRDYGVILDPTSYAIDEPATVQFRKERRKETKMFHRGEYYDGV
jgi:N-methylhydantoinase B